MKVGESRATQCHTWYNVAHHGLPNVEEIEFLPRVLNVHITNLVSLNKVKYVALMLFPGLLVLTNHSAT